MAIFKRRKPEADERHALSSADYLERCRLDLYLTDVVELLLSSREERPLEFVSEYFDTVVSGTHVAGRHHSFCAASPHNRVSLMLLAQNAFKNFDEMLAADLHQLLQLLCPDFPVDLVMQAARRLHPEQSAREAAAVPLRVAQMLQQLRSDFYFAEYLDVVRVRMLKRGNAEQAIDVLTPPAGAHFSAPSAPVLARSTQTLRGNITDAQSTFDRFCCELAAAAEVAALFNGS